MGRLKVAAAATARRLGFSRRHALDAGPDSAGAAASPLAVVLALVGLAHGVADDRVLVERLCQRIAESFGFGRILIWRLDPDQASLEPLAARDMSPDDLSRLPRRLEAWPLLREARERAAPVLVRDAREALALPATVVARYGVRAALAIPLLGADRCVGFLLADGLGKAFELDAGTREALTTASIVAGLVLESARARDDYANRDQLKTAFVALASHEVRSSAAAVCGAAATLQLRRPELSETQRDELTLMLYEQGEHLHRLVSQLLDLSRLEAPSLRIEPVLLDVRERIEEIVQRLAGGRAHELVLAVDPELRAMA